GLYVRALLYGLFAGPGADAEVRARLDAEPTDALAARLRAVDPPAAARIDANDRRRMVRALEVFELTGRPMSEHQAAHDVRRAPRRRAPPRARGAGPRRARSWAAASTPASRPCFAPAWSTRRAATRRRRRSAIARSRRTSPARRRSPRPSPRSSARRAATRAG